MFHIPFRSKVQLLDVPPALPARCARYKLQLRTLYYTTAGAGKPTKCKKLLEDKWEARVLTRNSYLGIIKHRPAMQE